MVQRVWQHTDPRGMSAAIVAALDPAIVPKTKDGQIADLRALLVATAFMLDGFSTVGPHPLSGGVGVDVGTTVLGERTREQFTSDERRDVARVLLETWRILVVADTQSNDLAAAIGPTDIATIGGAPAIAFTPAKEAGFAWPVAAVWIVGIGATAVVLLYVADKSGNVIDNELTRIEATRQMVLTQSKVLSVLADHKAAEDKAGAELPLTAAELEAIKALRGSQVDAQKAIKLNLPSLFPDMKDTGGKIISAATSLGWAAILVAGVIGYALFSRGK